MKNTYPIDVCASGTVLLGHRISCDGFHRDYSARVQTHVHDDHMDNFETSKGTQNLFMSEATRQLLVCEFNADLPYRQNVYSLELDATHLVDDHKLTLLDSGHMLGSVQVAVELRNGMRLGYSGDFRWPLDRVIEVEALVVDSTYGSPECKREYTQDQAEEEFLKLVLSTAKRGPVYIKAHRGTVQRALQILNGQTNCPLLGSARLCEEVKVYRDNGYSIGDICLVDSEAGRAHIRSGKFIRFYTKGDGEPPIQMSRGSIITLSAYMARRDDPVMEYSDCSFCVALSNHADFYGTLEYIQATKAKYVVTDNVRGGHGIDLALEIPRRLGIPARPSTTTYSREWGLS
jgi:putative mRNA 3-end processing factor